MNLLELVATLSLNSSSYEKGLNQAESQANSFGSKVGNGLKNLGKITAAGVGAAAAGIGKLAKSSIEAYGDFEQLKGGVETLFGLGGQSLQEYANSTGRVVDEVLDEWMALTTGERIVMNNATKAFQTAGLSANQYMETVTSFSASLVQSLKGDTAKAAEYADRAVIDMADNANKMGTDISMIQNAYQGFAKQNYTMLDNLKLGYGGTKEEMARLIGDASKLTDVQEKLGVTVDASSMSFGNIVNAISVMQESMGIAGTTAKEGAETIQGSIGMLKAAWENFVTSFGEDGDFFDSTIEDLSKSVSAVVKNIVPRLGKILEGIGNSLGMIVPVITEQLPALIDSLLPPLLDAAVSLFEGLVQALPSLLQSLIDVLPGVVNTILEVLMNNLPILIDFGLQMLVTLSNGIAQALPTLIPQITNVLLVIINTILNNIDLLADAAVSLMVGLGEGLVAAIPMIIEKIPEIIERIFQALVENGPELLKAGAELLLNVWMGIVNSLGKLLQVGVEIVQKVKEGVKQKIEDAKNWGKDLIANFTSGIKEKWNNLKNTVSDVAQSVKNFLGFSEPEEGPLSNFHTYAPDMMDLFIKGIKDNKDRLISAVSDAFDFEEHISKNPITVASFADNGYSRDGEKVYNYHININQPVSTPDEMMRTIRTESQYGLIAGEAL